ncbi:reverse transcriptase [Gossypium australe]|uniref:Reverse transcriptase n=1 Tax=Gossypium australe TaxID=47621 RepID=A0A5B6VXN8_9ROSI|nr:reverse transcriptase [Gossypium australe]
MNTQMALLEDGSILAELRAKPLFLQEICEAQKEDGNLQAKRILCESNVELDFRVNPEGCLMFRDRVCVPRNDELIRKILHEAHSGCLTVHPGSTKMYNDLRKWYWWPSMKKDFFEFVPRCLICQQVKVEHQVPSGLLQPIMIPEWKWDCITMDFGTGLALTLKKKDTVWIVVDRLTKSAHFIPVRVDYSLDKLVNLYVSEIILEDMLRCYVLKFQGNWEKYLSLVGFSYNNSFQSSLKMAPYEALYGLSPWKKVLRFGRKGKLSSRFIEPYEVTEKIGPVAYRLALPPRLEKIHDVFHVSMLHRYRSDPSHIIVPTEVEIRPDLTYGEVSIKILAREVKQLRNKSIALEKVLWHKQGIGEATWEPEETMRNQNSNLFTDEIFGDENP